MRVPFSKKEIELEPHTGEDVQEVTAIEKKLGISKVGT